MDFSQRRGLFKRAGGRDEEMVNDTKLVKAKPIPEKIARKLESVGAGFRGKDFQTASSTSQRDFYGGQEVRGAEPGKDFCDDPESEEEEEKPSDSPPPLSEEERNRLNAKILKAQLKGDKDRVRKLEAELKSGKSSRPRGEDEATSSGASRDILLTKTYHRSGLTVPLQSSKARDSSMKGRFEEQAELSELVREERMTTADDHLGMFAELAGKAAGSTKIRSDMTVDDVLESKKRSRKQQERDEQKKRAQAIKDQKRMEQTLESCRLCLDVGKVGKDGLICQGLKTYMAVPREESLVEGQVMIAPMCHVSSTLQADEDVHAEMMIWRKGLVRMYSERDEDVVFVEMAKNVDHSPHMCIMAYPMPKDIAQDAPIYFTKAIQECDNEWADNAKLLDLSNKGLRSSIPKGFSFVAVDFGLQPGYAHIIENEAKFQPYFAAEIIGGMLDSEARRWRKPHRLEKAERKKAAEELAKAWEPFDWTARVKAALDQ